MSLLIPYLHKHNHTEECGSPAPAASVCSLVYPRQRRQLTPLNAAAEARLLVNLIQQVSPSNVLYLGILIPQECT